MRDLSFLMPIIPDEGGIRRVRVESRSYIGSCKDGRDTGLEADEQVHDGREDELLGIAEKLCRMKAAEFAMLGYDQVTPDDVWACISARYQKNGFPMLHRMVNDILSLKATEFMNWMTMQAFKGALF